MFMTYDLCICAWPCVIAADKAATRYLTRRKRYLLRRLSILLSTHTRPETRVLYACGIAWRIVQSRFR